MRLLVLGCWLALIFASQTYACLWDSDTVANEAKGIPDAVDIIAGRFERNPPLYFQMRRERVLAVLKREPSNLAAYDDAAVACDRLGDDDSAIELMRQKVRQLAVANAPDKNEHLYRYEANLGTFYIHRWIRHHADRSNMGDVDLASQHIGEAIRINPKAHFGRERYQLLAINWIRNPPNPEKKQEYFPTFLTPPLSKKPKDNELNVEFQWDLVMSGFGGNHDILSSAGFGDAVEGLSGLIALGNAWESIDVFHALALALNVDGRSTIAFLAQLRIEELIDHGGRSFSRSPPSIQELKNGFSYLGSRIEPKRKPGMLAQYVSLRTSAEEWQVNRTAYMEERLKKGSHPDTDPKFWADYKEIPRPPLHTWHDSLEDRKPLLWTLVTFLLLSSLLGILVVFVIRRFRYKPA